VKYILLMTHRDRLFDAYIKWIVFENAAQALDLIQSERDRSEHSGYKLESYVVFEANVIAVSE